VSIDPQTPEEWRHAALLAEAMLRFDAALQYGLITGPAVNVERCEHLLEQARARGVHVSPPEIDDMVKRLVAEFAEEGERRGDAS
jgi:hypothetical protein